MIELYTAATPNGHKISIVLEELQLPYRPHILDLGKNEQKQPAFLKINPNGKIPAIIDRENSDFTVFDSGAILLYLAEKTGKLMPQQAKERSEVIQWLMFQMSGIGPMMGQANVWYRYWEECYQPAIDRYQHEVSRLFGVLNNRLSGRDYLVNTFSIADIANWAWVRTYKWSGVSLEGLPHLQCWVERMAERPACQRGINTPAVHIDQKEDADDFVKSARSMLVN